MVYCPQIPQDVKLHDKVHRRAVHGPRLPAGLGSVRLEGGGPATTAGPAAGAMLDVLTGRSPADLRWLREVARFAEGRVGAAPGWLLSRGCGPATCELYLYVSPGPPPREPLALLFFERALPEDAVVRSEVTPDREIRAGAGSRAEDGGGALRAGPRLRAVPPGGRGWAGVRLVWVRPDVRRQGLASGLLSAALRRAQRPGSSGGGLAFSSPTSDGEAWARALLRRRDFREAVFPAPASSRADLFTYDG